MKRPVDKENIKTIECKHASYSRAKDYSKDDLLTIKEMIHTKDGKKIPNLYFIKNFKKDFYVTKEGFRQKEAQKKEWEDINKLQKFTSTQAKLNENVAKALGRPGMKGSLKMLARSPFLYGADISTPTLIKKKYQDQFPGTMSENNVAVLDIETDVVNGTEEPIYVCISYKDKAILTVTESFVEGIIDFDLKLEQRIKELLPEEIKSRNLNVEIKICSNSGEACAYAISKAHVWMPDFLTIWNIDFDIPRIVNALMLYGYDPAVVFSDPKVPERFKYFNYRQGRTQKVTASGTVSSIHPAERWHVADCPASFHLIDSMCAYKRIRMAEKNETSYSLDFQLQKHLGKRKLKSVDLGHLSGLDWHVEMQKNHKLDYGVYNLFDCIGVELLDEKTKDLSTSISVQNGFSDYKIFDSQPRRLIDQLYFFVMGEGKIIASVSDDMEDELDAFVVGLKDWVITLPSHLIVDNGIPILEELPNVNSKIRVHNAD